MAAAQMVEAHRRLTKRQCLSIRDIPAAAVILRQGKHNIQIVFITQNRIGCDRNACIGIRNAQRLADLVDDLGLFSAKNRRECITRQTTIHSACAHGHHSRNRCDCSNRAANRTAALFGLYRLELGAHQAVYHVFFLFFGKMHLTQHIFILLVHRSSLPVWFSVYRVRGQCGC